MKSTVFLLAAILVAACAAVPTPVPTSEAPGWTTHPALRNDTLSAVGIVAARTTEENTLDDACVAARVLLGRAMSAHVVSVNVAIAWETGNWGRSDTVVAPPPEGSADLASQSTEFATWRDPTTGEGYCLVGMALEEADDPCLTLELCSEDEEEPNDSRPDWVDKPPLLPGSLTAVGYTEGSAYTGNLLEGSVRDAMGGLARTLNERVTGILASINSGSFGEPVEERIQSSEAWLQGARMVTWWRDRSRGGAYALVCMPTAGVKLRLAIRLRPEAKNKGVGYDSPVTHHEKQLSKLKALLDVSL